MSSHGKSAGGGDKEKQMVEGEKSAPWEGAHRSAAGGGPGSSCHWGPE